MEDLILGAMEFPIIEKLVVFAVIFWFSRKEIAKQFRSITDQMAATNESIKQLNGTVQGIGNQLFDIEQRVVLLETHSLKPEGKK